MISGIVWNTVMGRYRELRGGMDGLEASRVVRWEFVGDIADPRTETPNKRTVKPSKPTGRPKKWASEADRLRAYRRKRCD